MASSNGATKPQYFNYPSPKKAALVPYRNDAKPNPVIRGIPLAIGATIIRSVNFVQTILWGNAGFDKLRLIKELEDYEPRYDPTVIPLSDNNAVSTGSKFPSPSQRKNERSYYTSADYHALYLSQKLTPIGVIDVLLPLIRRDTSPPGEHSVAFLESKVDRIRAAAEASTERYRQGKPLGPLDGVPVAIKDEVDLAGYKRTLGSKLDHTGNKDATAWCVSKWEEAGAIIVGKTNMHEFGLDTTNNNPNTGTPLNPHNFNYYCGGSSGGSGYATSAGLCPITLGCDGGGSIRIPATFCGVYGLKTSHGRVSDHPTRSLAVTTGVCGPIAASLDDIALSYRVMAAPDPSSKHSSMFPDPTIPPSLPSPRAKTLGICKVWLERSDPAVLDICNKTIDYLTTEHGYTVVEIPFSFLPQGQKAHALTILSEIASGLRPDSIRSLTYPNQLLMSVAGAHATAQDFIASQKLRDMLMRHLAYLWQDHPGMVIVTPSTPVAGWKIQNPAKDLTRGVSDGDRSLRTMEYCWMANFTGAPAITFPGGYVEDGTVPVGIMGMGEWGSEEQLIDWARDAEGVLGEQGCKLPDPAKGGKWVDLVNLASQKANV